MVSSIDESKLDLGRVTADGRRKNIGLRNSYFEKPRRFAKFLCWLFGCDLDDAPPVLMPSDKSKVIYNKDRTRSREVPVMEIVHPFCHRCKIAKVEHDPPASRVYRTTVL